MSSSTSISSTSSSSQSALFPTSATSSYSALFPTSTASTNSGDGDGDKNSTNVYYLVFLGVLVVLMLIALCLAVRAMRMRRRYRRATRVALARGETVPDTIREDFWGLGGLAGWTSDGWDRFGAVRPGEQAKKEKKWDKMPVLVEAEAMKEAKLGTGDLWDEIRPLTVQSARLLHELPSFTDSLANFQSRHPTQDVPPRLRQPTLFSRNRNTLFSDTTVPSRRARKKPEDLELNRTIEAGEALRIAVVVQMPTFSVDGQRYRQGDNDEEVAWESGMELGLWEGVVEPHCNAGRHSPDPGQSFQNGTEEEEWRGLARRRSEESYEDGDIALYR